MSSVRNRAGRRLELKAHSVVGRSPASDIRLSSPAASFEHAAFYLVGGAWYLRDLGSRNGTYLNGIALPLGERVEVSWGDHIVFGDHEEEWIFESGVGAAGLAELQLMETSAIKPRVSIEELALRFAISPDAQDVALTIACPKLSLERALGVRSYFRLLLYMARARLEDRAKGAPLPEEGWRSRDSIIEALAISRNRMSVEVHRARVLLEREGILDANELFEVRRSSSTLRLGVADLIIE